MSKYFCHPAIETWLARAGIQGESLGLGLEVCFISTYQQQAGKPFSGLLQATKYRLINPHGLWIILLSFNSLKVLEKQDTYGILSLEGTELIRLPVSKEELKGIIAKCNVSPALTISEWERFSVPAYKNLLKGLIGLIKHDRNGISNKDYYGRFVNSLRLACLSKPVNLSLVWQCVIELNEYIHKSESMEEFLEIAKHIEIRGNDIFLSAASAFGKEIMQLAESNCKTEEEIKNLIFTIDNLNEHWSKLLQN